ncbi:unnamed protein product, partial [Protopolystoma xenopodis]
MSRQDHFIRQPDYHEKYTFVATHSSRDSSVLEACSSTPTSSIFSRSLIPCTATVSSVSGGKANSISATTSMSTDPSASFAGLRLINESTSSALSSPLAHQHQFTAPFQTTSNMLPTHLLLQHQQHQHQVFNFSSAPNQAIGSGSSPGHLQSQPQSPVGLTAFLGLGADGQTQGPVTFLFDGLANEDHTSVAVSSHPVATTVVGNNIDNASFNGNSSNSAGIDNRTAAINGPVSMAMAMFMASQQIAGTSNQTTGVNCVSGNTNSLNPGPQAAPLNLMMQQFAVAAAAASCIPSDTGLDAGDKGTIEAISVTPERQIFLPGGHLPSATGAGEL